MYAVDHVAMRLGIRRCSSRKWIGMIMKYNGTGSIEAKRKRHVENRLSKQCKSLDDKGERVSKVVQHQ